MMDEAQGLYDFAENSSVSNGFPDPEASNNWLCEQISSADNPGGANWQGYCNPDMDKLLTEQASTLDPNKRIDLYKQIYKRCMMKCFTLVCGRTGSLVDQQPRQKERCSFPVYTHSGTYRNGKSSVV